MQMTVLAIDPGPSVSAFVRWGGERIIDKGKIGNDALATMLTDYQTDCRLYVEMISHYGSGMPVGKEVSAAVHHTRRTGTERVRQFSNADLLRSPRIALKPIW